jgi:hypothetical protein
VRVIREVEHIPRRPSWDCSTCGQPWPCGTARTEIASGGDSTSRIIYLEIQLSHAQADMPQTPIGELYQRFIAWLGRRPPT